VVSLYYFGYHKCFKKAPDIADISNKSLVIHLVKYAHKPASIKYILGALKVLFNVLLSNVSSMARLLVTLSSRLTYFLFSSAACSSRVVLSTCLGPVTRRTGKSV